MISTKTLRYEITPNGKCPLCKTKIQVFEEDGIFFRAKTKYFNDGIRIGAQCPNPQCKRILYFIKK